MGKKPDKSRRQRSAGGKGRTGSAGGSPANAAGGHTGVSRGGSGHHNVGPGGSSGASGRDGRGKRRHTRDNRPPKRDASFGVIPVFLADGERQYLLIQHLGGHWGFPKGHPEDNETPQESASRELVEEAGLPCELIDGPRMIESYEFRQRGGRRVRKTVTYFIGYVASQDVILQEEEVKGAHWGNFEQTRAKLTFDEGRRLLMLAEEFLSGRASDERGKAQGVEDAGSTPQTTDMPPDARDHDGISE